jgi:dihydroorotase
VVLETLCFGKFILLVIPDILHMKKITIKTVLIPLVGCLLQVGCSSPAQDSTYNTVILNGRVMDPESGLDAVRHIGIRGGKIATITEDKLAGDSTIAASGLVVAPGFIDLHVHLFNPSQSKETLDLVALDGVTSALELEVGTADIEAWYGERAGGQIVNYGVSIGHIPVRMKIMGDKGDFVPSGPGGSEPASQDHILEMERLINQGLDAGGLGVGFGLAYTPAATTEEFETMLKVAAERGAAAYIHLGQGMEGLNQALESAANTGVSLHVVHVNSSGGSATADYLEAIQQAREQGLDVTTEAYPYEAGQTSIQSAFFDDWETWEDERFSTFQWVETGERLDRESFSRYRKQGGVVIMHSRTEEMTLAAIKHPLTMIASDGFVEDGKGHPRTSGTNAKVLGRYAREQGIMTLMDALRRMTIAPARRLETYVPAMKNKGRITLGADADITIFDANTVIDRSTYTEPTLSPDGMLYVLVNGVLVVNNGALVPGVRPGQAIRVMK